ncbi:MAG TPA: cysteine methyltransferase [Acholeplasmataceae bacterium]|nr:cysteine methyltransferase [Acholeplasmataceae bacterium]
MIGKYNSPLGMIYFKEKNGKIIDMMIDDLNIPTDDDPFIHQIVEKLDLYFNHQIKRFELPVEFDRGTPFQQEVWNAMMTIPYGEIRSYQDIAIQINRPKALRAVGQACKRNPIGIIVPCHRVLGKDGSLTGYSGKDHIDLKQKLLDHEKEGLIS